MAKMVMLGVAALAAAGAADAQRVVQHGPGMGYPPPAPAVRYPPLPPAPVQPVPGSRWGGTIGGRWWGGVNAPGGWAAYRAPYRGWRLPAYWLTPRFYVSDWSVYGLAPPPRGFFWTRYYDDAVLIDDRGQVSDWVSGVSWDRPMVGPYARRDDRGLAGAAVGAVAGGVAGNLVAGRGDKLAGTLIGAGVGGAAGYAIGHEHDRTGPPPPPPPPPPPALSPPPRPLPPPPTYGAGYGEPYPREERIERRVYDRGPPPGGPSWVSGDGRRVVTVTRAGGPAPVLYEGPPFAYEVGYGYGGSVTTVTVESAPVVTTTTTEIVEDRVTYTRPVARRVYRQRLWRPSKICRCR